MEREIADELQAHIEMRAEERSVDKNQPVLRVAGIDPMQALRSE
jgi:hypothetical protein